MEVTQILTIIILLIISTVAIALMFKSWFDRDKVFEELMDYMTEIYLNGEQED